MNIHSYPSIYALGHKAIADLLNGPVIVEEKVDGSQFSFVRKDDNTFEFRSKGCEVHQDDTSSMFGKVVTQITENLFMLPANVVFRGEYLSKPAHNVAAYNRVPKHHIIIFDIDRGDQDYMSYEDKADLAHDLDLEVVPRLFEGMLTDVNLLRELLERESILGGQKIEGVVIKPVGYDLFGRDKKVLMGKFVSETFKETHAAEWKKTHGTKGPGDVIAILAAAFSSPARWDKAVLHLRERTELEDSPRDIGKLMMEVPADVLKECKDEISEQLWKWAWPQLCRRLTAGLPEWYKQRLMDKQFSPPESKLTLHTPKLANEDGENPAPVLATPTEANGGHKPKSDARESTSSPVIQTQGGNSRAGDNL